MAPTKVLSRDDYTIGWVTALPLELAAATAMLDEEHKRPSKFIQPSTDHNTYTWGCIEEHNVILALLPAGVYGTVSAATVASNLLSSFPYIQVGLMVGIGAGVPRPTYDIRLGDVVVSKPGGQSGGVIQYDLGKALDGDRFERKGSLNMPPEVLRTALGTLAARHELTLSKVPQILEHMLQNNPFMAHPPDEKPGYAYQGEKNDRLFTPDYQHVGGLTCEGCDPCREVERKPRRPPGPRIHYGTIASGNTLIKDAKTRDSIAKALGEDCICFEMEAAGLMNSFPGLVIRGISDYADSHKNDRWQRHAAAAAAAYTKELLSVVPKVSIPSPRRTSRRMTDEAKQSLILNALKFDAMDERFHDISSEAGNTFRWIFNDYDAEKPNPLFKSWLTSGSGMFHICGKLGSGKSTLMKYIRKNDQTAQSLQIWAQERHQQLITAQFFFWKPGGPRQKSYAGLVRSLLAQILRQCPKMIDALFSNKLSSSAQSLYGEEPDITISDDEAAEAFNQLIHHDTIRRTHCFCFFIDGLDEFEEKYRTYTSLVGALNKWISGDVIKLCVSSRELDIFQSYLSVSRKIKLQDFTYHDIETLVHQTLNEHVHFQWLMEKDSESCERLLERVTEKAEGVFLWVVLASKRLSEGLEDRYSVEDLLETLRDIPDDLKELFQRTLRSIPKSHRRKTFCMFSIMAKLHELHDQETIDARFSLLAASFLNDYFQDPTFAEKRSSQEMSEMEVDERLVQSKAQWLGHCKGLLEVRPNRDIRKAFWGDELKFTHRSVPEYLQEHGSHFEDVEVFGPLVQSCLAVVKAVPFSNDIEFFFPLHQEIKVLLIIIRECPMADQLRYYPLLEQIERALQVKQPQTGPGFPKSRWKGFRPSMFREDDRTPYMSLLHIACEALFYEYIQWKFKSTTALHQIDETESFDYLTCVLDGLIEENNNPTRTQETLRILLQQGCNPNPSPDSEYYDELYDPWIRLLVLRQMKGQGRWAAAEVLLEFGAYRPRWTCTFRTPYPVATIKFAENKRYSYEIDVDHMPSALELSWSAKLQDWVEFEKPENAEAILKLLKEPNHRPVE